MTARDLEVEYNNRARVPEHPALQARWASASAVMRQTTGASLDRAYGSRPRQKFDLFTPQGLGTSAPLVVYIHGGYWQRGERTDNAFVARELVARGVAVAVVGYTLCPEVGVLAIIGELRQALKSLWYATQQYPVVVGHSAGGHLAAAMLATDWSTVGHVPADLVRAAYAISGVFDVAPLLSTSLNALVKLDAATATAVSPLYWPPPPKDRTFVAAVGGDESQEFIRQSLAITAAWSRAGVKAECIVVPATNHFTVVDELTNPDSAMVARVTGLARVTAANRTGA
jgi:arylformamidase